MSADIREIQKGLAAYFAPDEIEWKPQSVNGNRALAVAYIDSRCVMDRLDAVMGPENWQDTYHILEDGCVVCKLSLRLQGEWITKEDVGGESDQKDIGDKRKSSFSDALKRAAVKWAIGRYLYSLPKQWVDFDPQKKQLSKIPQLPSWAIPKIASNPQKPAQESPAQPSGVGITMVHQRLKERDKTWRDALHHVCGINMGEDFDEPETAPQAVMVLAPLLTPDQVDKLKRNVQPKEKVK